MRSAWYRTSLKPTSTEQRDPVQTKVLDQEKKRLESVLPVHDQLSVVEFEG